jgi:DUF971 family protein
VTERAPDATRVAGVKAVGRYAIGIDWADRHDSIIPFRNLRRACPCESCVTLPADTSFPAEAEQVRDVQLLGEQSMFIRWGDGHESVLLCEEVRDLCRCARCIGEPDYPISGQ